MGYGREDRPFAEDAIKAPGDSGKDRVSGSFDSARCAPLRMTSLFGCVMAAHLVE